MSDYIIHTETYTHKNGKTYVVEVSADDHCGAPDEEHDCHGVVVELAFDPDDEEAVSNYIADNTEEGSIEEIEERARLALMRPLGNNSYNRWATRKYYDVWETRKKAAKEWGVEESKVQEVVDKDFEYLDGWYSDDWHWCVVSVYATDERGEKDKDYCHHCGGYESTIFYAENRTDFDSAIEDLIADVEHDIRKELHKDQLELPLFA